eukprot:COSAG06_NODE_13381_length_1263_cov_1.283505_1_plen_91_part_10
MFITTPEVVLNFPMNVHFRVVTKMLLSTDELALAPRGLTLIFLRTRIHLRLRTKLPIKLSDDQPSSAGSPRANCQPSGSFEPERSRLQAAS